MNSSQQRIFGARFALLLPLTPALSPLREDAQWGEGRGEGQQGYEPCNYRARGLGALHKTNHGRLHHHSGTGRRTRPEGDGDIVHAERSCFSVTEPSAARR